MSSFPGEVRQTGFPWAGQPDAAACTLAVNALVRDILEVMTENGRVHAPTLMTTVGAVAGFCAHISLVSDPKALQDAADAGALSTVSMKDGRDLLVGDAINLMLCTADPALAPSRVWNTLAGTAISLGATPESLPDLDGMFARVARSLGTDREGFPAIPETHMPMFHAREGLRVAGPLVVRRLTTGDAGKVEETSWVAIGAQLAPVMLRQGAAALPPQIGAQIAMESAILLSKMRPKFAGQA